MKSDKDILQLQWEAPAGRQPDDKIVVRVDELEAADKGVLGSVENHPSLAHSMPNPIEIRGTVLHPRAWIASLVKLKYPKYKMKDAKLNDRVALALVKKVTCICAGRVPEDVTEAGLSDWLEHWTCKE